MPKKPAAPAAADILSYRHPDRRKNNPEVGMVTPATDPDEEIMAFRFGNFKVTCCVRK